MWTPHSALTAEEPHLVTRTRQTRKCCVFLREPRHALLDADVQPTLAHSSRPEHGGHEPLDAGRWALQPRNWARPRRRSWRTRG